MTVKIESLLYICISNALTLIFRGFQKLLTIAPWRRQFLRCHNNIFIVHRAGYSEGGLHLQSYPHTQEIQGVELKSSSCFLYQRVGWLTRQSFRNIINMYVSPNWHRPRNICQICPSEDEENHQTLQSMFESGKETGRQQANKMFPQKKDSFRLPSEFSYGASRPQRSSCVNLWTQT